LSKFSQIFYTSIFLGLVTTDLVLVIFRKSFCLTIINPAFGYGLSIMMMFSANLRNALITLALTSFSFLIDTWTLCKLWIEARNKMRDQCGPAWCIQPLYVAVGVINLLAGGVLAFYFFINALEAGGVCIRLQADKLETDGSYIFTTRARPEYCEVCPDGGAANTTHITYTDENGDEVINDSVPIVSNCPGNETYSTYCGLVEDNFTDFCFLEW
jgi:hypothetical protein